MYDFCLGTEVPRHSAGCVGMYVRGTYVRAYVAFCNAPTQVQQPALHSYLNRVSNVFIACK